MEDNKKGGYGRRSEDRREYGDRSFRKDGENRNSGRYSSGEKRSYSGERKTYSGERRNYGERRSSGFGNESGERRSYGDRPTRNYGERRFSGNGYGREDREGRENRYSGERRSSEGYRKPKSYGQHSDERRSGAREWRSDDRRDGERRSNYGQRRGFEDRRPASEGHKRTAGRRPRISTRDIKSEIGIERMISRRPGLNADAYSDNDLVQVPVKEIVRLNKFIANSGVCSRREADNMILAGTVTVNGEVVTELGTKVNINTDDVRFNGERLKGEAKVYIVMNKPKGYVTTASDPHADKTVMDLLKGCTARVFPVGRLDKNTTGVLMFTNDGEMAEKLTHPSYDKKKIYQVSLSNKLAKEDYDKILEGIALSDGVIAADELEYIDEEDHRKLGIEIHSGKNRIVRRIFESLGYDVKALDRVYFAGLTKRGLKKGEWRFLTEGEVNILKMGAYN